MTSYMLLKAKSLPHFNGVHVSLISSLSHQFLVHSLQYHLRGVVFKSRDASTLPHPLTLNLGSAVCFELVPRGFLVSARKQTNKHGHPKETARKSRANF